MIECKYYGAIHESSKIRQVCVVIVFIPLVIYSYFYHSFNIHAMTIPENTWF